MTNIPWMLLELVYPIFMVILVGVASVGKGFDFLSYQVSLVKFMEGFVGLIKEKSCEKSA